MASAFLAALRRVKASGFLRAHPNPFMGDVAAQAIDTALPSLALIGDLGGSLGAPIIAKGTAFPGSPISNQLFFRTDLGAFFFWNGTFWIQVDTAGLASLTSSTGAINTVETNVISILLPANIFQAGTTVRITFAGLCTTTVGNTSSFRVRMGGGNSSTDALITVMSPAAAGTTGTNVPFFGEFNVTCRAPGATGTFQSGSMLVSSTIGVSTVAAIAADVNSGAGVNTTVNAYLHLSYQSPAATTTCTFDAATIELVKA
jgi:hypothetical protein